jgi:5-methylcytosine-specific restriction endonuclease McrA
MSHDLNATKQCSKCQQFKPLSEAWNQNWCQACRDAYNKVYYAKNKEKVAAQTKARRAENREEHLASRRDHYKKNREKILETNREYRAKNREKTLQRHKEYRKKNPEKFQGYAQTRRERERNAHGDYTEQQLADRRAMWDNKCGYCGGEVDVKDPFGGLDHQIPLAKGGTNWPANLVPCCTPCNTRKTSRTAKEFGLARVNFGVMPAKPYRAP